MLDKAYRENCESGISGCDEVNFSPQDRKHAKKSAPKTTPAPEKEGKIGAKDTEVDPISLPTKDLVNLCR